MNEGTRVLVGLGVGLGAGLAIAASHNPAMLRAADSVAPIGSLWVNAIRMTVIPLIVSLVITGVASASSVGTVGRDRPAHDRGVHCDADRCHGPRAAAWHRGLLVDVPHRHRPARVCHQGAAEAASSLATSATPVDFGSWLISLVPTNPVAAAANGAMLPLVIFTVLLALAIAHSPADGRDVLLGFFRGLGDAMQVLVRWVIWCAPVGIFALMLPLGAHGGAGFVGAVGFYIAAYSLASILFVLLLYPAVALFARLPMREFARAALPGQLIAFSSSSSIASLPALVRGADEQLKLPKDVTGFVLPLAISMFKFAAPVSWTIGTLFVAWFYRVDLGPSAYLTIAVAAIFLAFCRARGAARRLPDAGADVLVHRSAG
jgi:Na+/H+-dicarboxylate symporter